MAGPPLPTFSEPVGLGHVLAQASGSRGVTEGPVFGARAALGLYSEAFNGLYGSTAARSAAAAIFSERRSPWPDRSGWAGPLTAAARSIPTLDDGRSCRMAGDYSASKDHAHPTVWHQYAALRLTESITTAGKGNGQAGGGIRPARTRAEVGSGE